MEGKERNWPLELLRRYGVSSGSRRMRVLIIEIIFGAKLWLPFWENKKLKKKKKNKEKGTQPYTHQQFGNAN
jgi:hypothetical protein